MMKKTVAISKKINQTNSTLQRNIQFKFKPYPFIIDNTENKIGIFLKLIYNVD